MKHKHADLIHAWADGAEIEVFDGTGWTTTCNPNWQPNNEYRIKPEEKNPVVRWLWAYKDRGSTQYRQTDFLTEAEAFSRGVNLIKLEWSRTEFPD